MLVLGHKESKAQSGTKGSKKKKVTLSASYCFCVFAAINIPQREISSKHTLPTTAPSYSVRKPIRNASPWEKSGGGSKANCLVPDKVSLCGSLC